MKPFPVLVSLTLVTALCPLLSASGEEDWQSMNLEIARLYSEGDVESAVRLAEQSLAIAKKEFGLSHLNTAKALNNMANLYFRTGRLDEAGWMYEDALAIEEKELGRESVSAADTLYNLSMLLLYRKENVKAKVLLERSLAIHRMQNPPDAKALQRIEAALAQIIPETSVP